MLSIILILLVVWLVLSLLLAAWTLFFQGYIYSEPASGIYWRAPAAAIAITLFLAIWITLDYRSIGARDDEGRYQPLHYFSPSETVTYEHIWIYNRDGRKEHYILQNNRYERKDGRRLPERPLQIIASHQADGEQQVFKPPTDANGNLKTEKNQSLRYYEEGNPSRYMESIGQISIFHFGWLVMGLLLNFGLLIVWFLCLWLLLDYQWPHALGLAFVAWLISLFILPMILAPAENVRKERLPAKTASLAVPSRSLCQASRDAASGTPCDYVNFLSKTSERRPLRS